MADEYPTLAGALSIPAAIIPDLTKVDRLIESMDKHTSEMVQNFNQIKTGFGDLITSATTLEQKMTSIFNAPKIMEAVAVMGKAISQMASMGAASGKSSLGDSEDSLNNRLMKIWQQRADTYASITRQMEQLDQYRTKMTDLQAKKAANGEVISKQSIDNMDLAGKVIDALRDRLKQLGLAFDATKAQSSVSSATGMNETDVASAMAKLEALKEARRQVLLPGGGADAELQNSWLKQLDAQIASTTSNLKVLEQNAIATKQKATSTDLKDNSRDAWADFFAKDDDIDAVSEALKRFKEIHRSMKAEVKRGNPFISQSDVDNALNAIKSVQNRLNALKESKKQSNAANKATSALAAASGMDENSVDEIKRKIQAYEKALDRLKLLQAQGNVFVNPNDIDNAKQKIGELREKLSGLTDQAGNASNVFLKTSQSASMLGNKIQMAFGVFGITKFVKEVVRVRAEFSKIERSLAVLVQSEADARKIFSEVQDIAIHSPYEIKDIAAQVRQISAYGIETDKLIEKTKMLGDIASGTGVELNRLALAYGQIRAATVLKGQEARQLTEAGVDIFGGLAQYYSDMYQRGVSAAEVMDMMRKKMISFSDVDVVLQRMTSVGGKFYKMQEKQAETIGGMISNLKDRASIAFNQMGTHSEDMMKKVVNGIISILSNARALESIFHAVFGYTIVRMIGSVFAGAMKMSKAFIYSIKQLKTLQGLSKAIAMTNLFSMSMGALIGVIALFHTLFSANRQLEKELKKIHDETISNADSEERAYRRTIDAISDETSTIAEKQKALDSLKATYGNILPLEQYSLSNIKELKEATEDYVKILRTRLEEEGRQRQVETILTGKEAQSLEEKAIKAIKNRMLQQDIVDKDLFSADEIAAAFNQKYDEAIREGDFKIARLNELIRTLARYKGLSDEVTERLATSFYYANIQGATSYAATLESVFKKLDKIFNRSEKEVHIDIESNVSIDAVKKDCERITKAYKDELTKAGRETTEDGIGEAIVGNNAAIRIKAREAAETAYQSVLDGIEEKKNAGDFDIDGVLNEALVEKAKREAEAYFLNVIGDPFTQALDKVYDKINKEFADKDDLGFDLGTTGVTQKAGNKSPEDYIKDLKNYISEMKKYTGDISKINNIRSREQQLLATRLINELGFESQNAELNKKRFQNLWTEEQYWNETLNLITTKIIPASQLRIQEVEKLVASLGDIFKSSTSGGGGGGRSFNDMLADLIQALRQAAKEWEHLDDAGKKILSKQIKIKASKLSIKVPDKLDKTSLEELVQNLLSDKRLKQDNVLSISLDINKDNLKESFDDIKKEVQEAWSDYDMAKKLEDWGIKIEGISTEESMKQLLKMESKLREKGRNEELKDATELADEIKKKRLDIYRKEREDAIKIMHDAEKKAQDKTLQIYQDTHEKVSKIVRDVNKGAEAGQEISTDVVDEKVSKIVRKAYEDIAKAQWDAYKSTEMYTEAFGHLDTTSREVLETLRQQITEFMKNGGLNPSDMKAAQKALENIEDQLNLRSDSKSYWTLLGEDMRRYYDAKKDYDATIEGRKAAFTASTEAYNEARQELANTEELYDAAASRAAEAQLQKDQADRAKEEAADALAIANEQKKKAKEESDKADKDLSGANRYNKKDKQEVADSAKEALTAATQAATAAEVNYQEAINASSDANRELEAATAGLNYALSEQDRLVKKVADAEEDMNKKGKSVTKTEKAKKEALTSAKKHLDSLISSYDAVANEITNSIGLVRNFADAMGIAFGDDANEALDAFAEGFGLVSTALSVLSGALAIFTAMEESATAAGLTLETVLWPLLVIALALGAISAIIKAADNAKVAQIDKHKETVEQLQKEYDKLKDTFEEVMRLDLANKTYKEELENLRKQRVELEAIIALEQSRGVKMDEDALKGYYDDLDELNDKAKEAEKQMMETLNLPANFQDLAKDFASSWLDAFKDTGRGMSALKESFNDMYEDMVVGQLQFKVMGPAMEKLQQMIKDAAEDLDVTPAEAAAIKAEWENTRAYVNQMMTEWARAYGIGIKDSLATDTLQRGVQSLSEDTGQVIESYLNSMRMLLSENNLTLTDIRNILQGGGDGYESPMLNELKAQTAIARRIEDALGSVIRSGHTKGGSGLKVFLD